MPLKLKLQLKQDDITGFSYSFAKLLLTRLCELYSDDKLWTYYQPQGEKKKVNKQTVLSGNLIYYLSKQIPSCDWVSFEPNIVRFSRKYCAHVLKDAESFLKTFEPELKLKIKDIYPN